MHLCPALLEAPDGIELLRELRRHCRSVTSEVHSYGAAEHAFVSRHPPQAELVTNGHGSIRKAALRWAGPSRPHAKPLLMQVEPATQLLTGVLRMVEAMRRQGKVGRRDTPRVGI